MDPNAVLAQIRGLVTSYNNGGKWDNTDTDDLVRLVDDLDTWMTRHGFLPTEWSPAADSNPPKIEVFHARDYDGECDLQVYLNGEMAGIHNVYDFDPGRGHDFRDYVESLTWDVAHASPGLRGLVEQAAWTAVTDDYVEGQPDDERVAERYFDLWVLRHEREAAAANGTPPATPPQQNE